VIDSNPCDQPAACGRHVCCGIRHVEGREDRARLCGRHGAAARELHQGRSIEATEHDADLYVFRGKSGKLIKILWHDGLGMSLYAKRLERGRFLWPSPADGVVTITPAQLGP
jgi:transposase